MDDRDPEEPDGSEEGNVLPRDNSTEYILTSENKAIRYVMIPTSNPI